MGSQRINTTEVNVTVVTARSLHDPMNDALAALNEAAWEAAKVARKLGHRFSDDLLFIARESDCMKDTL